MIYLEKNSTTEWYTPSKQLQTIENPYYLMQIRSQDTKEYKYMMVQDTGTASTFAKFSITEGATFSSEWILSNGTWNDVLEWVDSAVWLDNDSGFVAGQISLDVGMYDYVLYESDYDSLNTASASNILNIGLMRVVGTEWTPTEPVYDDLNDTITYRYTD